MLFRSDSPAFTAQTSSYLASSSKASEQQTWRPKAPTPMKKSPIGVNLPMKVQTAIAAVTQPLTFGEVVAQTTGVSDNERYNTLLKPDESVQAALLLQEKQ